MISSLHLNRVLLDGVDWMKAYRCATAFYALSLSVKLRCFHYRQINYWHFNNSACVRCSYFLHSDFSLRANRHFVYAMSPAVMFVQHSAL